VFHEFVSGPLNAVRAAARRQDQLDPAANPTSLFGAGGLFNFNYVRVARQADGKVHLIADVRNEAGVALPESVLDLTPR
jgi:hypothetical protein